MDPCLLSQSIDEVYILICIIAKTCILYDFNKIDTKYISHMTNLQCWLQNFS